MYIQTKRKVVMPPPPNYPKDHIRVMNPIVMNPKLVSSSAKQDANGNIVVTVSLWK